MSGHNKWSQIKRQKGTADAKRSNVFTKLANAVTIASKNGKGLDIAVEQAKKANMPKDRIDKAIARGKGELEGAQVEEVIYEAYGPNGVAIIVRALTDNKNRTISELRSVLNKSDSTLANSGAVSYLFENKGIIEVNKKLVPMSKEDAEMVIIDSGADDFSEDEEIIYVYTKPKKLEETKKFLEFKAIPVSEARNVLNPKTYTEVPAEVKEKIINLLSAIENLDDIYEVFTNADL